MFVTFPVINTPTMSNFMKSLNSEFERSACNWLLQVNMSWLQHTLGRVITGIHSTSLREAEPSWEKTNVHTVNRNSDEECWRDRSKFSLARAGKLSFNK